MKQRIISASVALLITVPLILLGGIYFELLVIALGVLGFRELIKVKKIPSMVKYISYILFVVNMIYGYTFISGMMVMNYTLTLLIILFLTLSLIIYHDNKIFNIEDVFYILSSIIFLSAAFYLFLVIRNEGLMLTVYLFLITIVTDTFAYVMGSKFGKHKLIPSISPNKSIEGSIWGSVVGTIVASIFYILCVSNVNIFEIIIVTFILTIIGQCGDLVFSSIKRHFKIKDFSNIMPGHGGILDRLDSIIFVIIAYIIYSTMI